MPRESEPRHPGADWGRHTIDTPDLMQTLQDDLPIRLIATPRHYLRTCRSDEALVDVLQRNDEAFDFVPVMDGSTSETERIVGLIELARYTDSRAPDCRVGTLMRPLSEENLIGADASILSFLKDADRHPCRLVIARSHIAGLVSLSDLQKLPVRAALFALITYLEMVMAQAIRRDCPDPDAWKRRLSAERRSKLEEAVRAAKIGDNWIDDLLLTQFADKVQIIKKSAAFRDGKGAFESAMKKAQNLRDHLAHANDYARSRAAAIAICETVRIIENRIAHLALWPQEQSSSEGR